MPDQLGLEPTPEAYVARMVEVFRHVWKALRDDGTLWLNMGDGYAGGHATYKGGDAKWQHGENNRVLTKRTLGGPGLKPKDLMGVPWLLAFALRADGWYLRCHMPWVKRSAMPESCTDRPAKATEDMFLFAKKPQYYFDMDAIKLKAAYAGKSRGGSTNRYEQNAAGMDNTEYATRNYRNGDLWFQSIDAPHGLVVCNGEMVGLDVNPESYSGAHFATFPPKLITPCILAGTSAKGCCPECGAPWERVVEREVNATGRGREHIAGGDSTIGQGWEGTPRATLNTRTTGWRPTCDCGKEPVPCTALDPFFGAGTTAVVAQAHGRDWLGIELNPEYAQQAQDRIDAAANPETWTKADAPADSPLFEAEK